MTIQDWTQASAPFIENMVYDTDPATNRARPRPEQHKLFPRMIEVLMKNATYRSSSR
ncbi:hypothetical protein SUNI508_01331 [Seiridium unicorne]|uniref:Uncharacterized protein n=1 Tax=Seiridium unicorne TaxID=138068 RepID=A0ABR2UYD0_9PEZI